MEPESVVLIVVGSLIFSVLMLVLGIVLRRRMSRPSKSQRAEMAQLTTTGARARATVVEVRPTGAVVNNVNFRAEILYQLDPLDRSPSFEATKKAFFNHGTMPRVGDVAPAWYDREDPTRFAVALPGPPTSEQFALFRQFDLRHPADTRG